jgi:PAS domain S-box-containing protein
MTIAVGLLQALTGRDAAVEEILKDGALRAIGELNAQGGVLGQLIQAVEIDTEGSEQQLTRKVAWLLERRQIQTFFGLRDSRQRKALLPILATHGGHLWFPSTYEGLEEHPQVFYTGLCPNQGVLPALSWMEQHHGDRPLVIYDDSIYGRVLHCLVRSRAGQGLRVAGGGEGLAVFAEVLGVMQQQRPSFILCLLGPVASQNFLLACAAAGDVATPILFCHLREEHIRELIASGVSPGSLAGRYLCGSATPAAYGQLFLWQQAVTKAGSTLPELVRQAAIGLEYGGMALNSNHHVTADAALGWVQPTGTLERVESWGAIAPLPWWGVESFPSQQSRPILELLANVTETLSGSWQLDRDAQELEQTIGALLGGAKPDSRKHLAPEITRAVMTKLLSANQRLKQAQAELIRTQTVLRETNQLLERRVRDRTQQLQSLIHRLKGEILERQAKEQRLEEREAQFAAMAANVPGVIYRAILHVDGSVSMPYISPRTEEIFGLSPAEFLQHLEWIFDLAHPEDRATLTQKVHLSATTLTPFEHEYRAIGLTREPPWVRLISAPHRTATGDIVWDGIIINITAEKRAEEELRTAEAKYRGIFENALEGIFVASLEGSYLSANPALARIYGYRSPQTLLTAQLPRLGFLEPSCFETLRHHLRQDGAIANFEAQIAHLDGSTLWVLVNARLIAQGYGEAWFEGIVQDITERKLTEVALHQERQRSEQLLLNVLPQVIVQQLKLGPGAIATRYEAVTIVFADIVDFTSLAARIPATELVALLNDIFSSFDILADQYGLEKIKTIGDAYMAVAGLPTPCPDHAQRAADLALALQREMGHFQRDDGTRFRLRIGINTGAAIAGVIGIKKFIYDLWGDAVNIASRMESQGLADSIQVTESTYALLRHAYHLEPRGTISVKGKGKMSTYLLLGKRDPTAIETG